jgi:heptosyltransferase-2
VALPGKFLVVRGGAIGDFILTLPVLAALRRQFPKAGLEVLGYAHIAQLAHAAGLADAVRPIDARPLASFFAKGGDLDPQLKQYFAGFAVVISYLYDPDHIFQDNVRRSSAAQFIAGPHRPSEQGQVHAVDLFLEPLQRLAIFDADAIPRLMAQPITRGLPTIAVHPGSGSERKNWPENKWKELLTRFIDQTSCEILLIGGDAESERLSRLATALPPQRFELARNLPLPDLARMLAGCAFFVGHDSGITHLACAVGLPSLVLWGDSVEDVWRPRGRDVTIIREADGLRALAVDRVMETFEETFSRIPTRGAH